MSRICKRIHEQDFQDLHDFQEKRIHEQDFHGHVYQDDRVFLIGHLYTIFTMLGLVS